MMHTTRNHLSPSIRTRVVPILASLLADSSDLYSQCKQAHWNVRGTGFIGVHELFDKLGAEVSEAADTIAERMQQLGSSVSGTVRTAAMQSRLKEYPLAALGTVEQHVDALTAVLATFNSSLLDAIGAVDEAGDVVTVDMLTSIARGLDKHLWFVESYLLAPNVDTQAKLTSVRT